jgi:hypothetical protein
MTYYLGLMPTQEPFDMGEDEQGRARRVFNVVAFKRSSSTFVEEVLACLEEAGVGTRGVDLFGTSSAIIPEPDMSAPDVSVLHVRSTGGPGPVGTHNQGAIAYRRPGAQILARARSGSAAEAMIQAAFAALCAVRNREVVA